MALTLSRCRRYLKHPATPDAGTPRQNAIAGTSPRPAARLSRTWSDRPVPGMAQVTAGWLNTNFSSGCAQLVQPRADRPHRRPGTTTAHPPAPLRRGAGTELTTACSGDCHGAGRALRRHTCAAAARAKRGERGQALTTKGHDMKRFVLVLVASIFAVSATVSCDKLKSPAPPLPLPKTEPASPVPQVTAPKEQASRASVVR